MARLNYEMNRQKAKVPMPELDPAERAKTFDEVAKGYSEEDAVAEARRCIQCPNAPCVGGCPVGVPIPQFVAQVAEGDFARAYAIVKGANALPAICGRVCPQETQCEGVCTRGRSGEPVGIGRLERFVSDWAFAHPKEAAAALDALREECAAGDEAACGIVRSAEGAVSKDLAGKRVAVVGSGPASLTCAGELAKREVAKLGEIGVSFETNALVGRLYDIDELMDERGFDAVFVGTGAGLPSYLGIEGEGLNGVMVANELLTRVNLMKAYEFPAYDTPVYAGKRCVVVGGGNVAMDAARTAKRLGADVCVVYRRGREEMPARAEEIHHAEQEGIEFKLLTNPVRVVGDDAGWVRGLECVRMELGAPDASGRRRPEAVAGSEFSIDIDMLVIAVGSKTNPLVARATPGLEVTPRNLIVVDERTCATSKPGVFAGGDAVIGAATVILAMGAGKRAAAGIAEYLASAV
ncbi:MAG TPA: FAD-dependent oxidoreductase [Rubneribacter badeniensis]|uniref:FAD-dependent oxidoreductase n=1 Tax=Rubneribacter badeniensis TaxID=2070688 RepID=A0A9D3ACU0_9ACTN|nr:FAD-dependent oxidoreductase [Rubneribacter badeniensis]